MKFSLGLTAALTLAGYVSAAALPEPASSPEPVINMAMLGPAACAVLGTILVVQNIGPTVTVYTKTATATKSIDCSGCDLVPTTIASGNAEPIPAGYKIKTVTAKSATTITVPKCISSCSAPYTITNHYTIAPTVTVTPKVVTSTTSIDCGACKKLYLYRLSVTTSYPVPVDDFKVKTVTAKGTSTQYVPTCATARKASYDD
ncbi:hypothetical protein ABW20_dc0100338 [Dactylellina cionopaga]|nr:hypothetical protein ABW20_dc0100338 [Dactylellina cionopaga]